MQPPRPDPNQPADQRTSATELARDTVTLSVTDGGWRNEPTPPGIPLHTAPAPGDELSIDGGATLAFYRLCGVDRDEDLVEQLRGWRRSVTTNQPRFHVNQRMGEGSQGLVFSIKDRDCRRDIALKTLRHSGCDLEEISRFIHEAQVTAQLEHPGIVPVHDFGVLPNGTVFYTMKRVEGQSLADYLVTRAGKSEHRFDLLQLFLRVGDALAFAHSRGVIHRDVKPRNIMVGNFGEVLLMDWGLAKVVGAPERERAAGASPTPDSDGDVHRTQDGCAVGTPAYMSPEQARGTSEMVDHRGDIYSLGVILYEMLSGSSPYVRGDVQRTLRQASSGNWLPLDRHLVGRDLPRALAAITHKAMAHTASDRYQSVEALAADVRNFLAGQAVSAYRESPLEALLRVLARHRKQVQAIIATTVLAGCLGLGVWMYLDWRRSDQIRAMRELAQRQEDAGDFTAARTAYEHILAYLPADRAALRGSNRADERIKERREAEALDLRLRDAARARNEARAAEQRGGEQDLRIASEGYIRVLTWFPGDQEALAAYEAVTKRQAQAEQSRQQEGLERDRTTRALELAERAARSAADGHLQEAVGFMEASLAIRYVIENSQAQRRWLEQLQDEQRAATKAQRHAEAEAQFAQLKAEVATGNGAAARERLAQARALDPEHPQLAHYEAVVQASLRQQQERAADALLTQAQEATLRAGAITERVETLAATTRQMERQLVERGDTTVREQLHQLEKNLTDLGEDRSNALALVIGLLHRAQALTPDYPPVRHALCDYFIARLLEAEAEGKQDAAAAAQAQGLIFDDGSRHQLLAGMAQVECPTDAPALLLRPIGERPDRSDAADGDVLAIAAGAVAMVKHGRYEVRNAAGAVTARCFARGGQYSILLPAPPTLPPGIAFVPAGTVFIDEGKPGKPVDAFALAMREVTCGEYLEFLNDPAVHLLYENQLQAGKLILAPRASFAAAEPLWRQRAVPLWRKSQGDFMLEAGAGENRELIPPDRPVSGISYEDAIAYTKWRAARDQLAWRLPTAQEWQLAAQGGDGRRFPWGNRADLSFCASVLTVEHLPSGYHGGGFPTDRSVQGVLDLAGSLSEFCDGTSPINPSWHLLLGGNCTDREPERFSSFHHREVDGRAVHSGFGFRLALSLPAH